ncbi:MAG: oligoendopeptidase F [Nitrospina sp.]|jgi:oligoendopeptidase F|nr:oligoendopeptidase F [Nitrospina sp.]MBT6717044.1 oligoendopeptidase F [Nitrospina sp.]
MDAKAGTLTRDEIPENSQWDLSGLYSSNEEWDKNFEALEGDLSRYASFQGTLGESCLKLKECIEFDMNFSRKLEKLYTFAHLKNDEDKTNSFYQGNFEKAMRLLNEAGSASSFIRPEIMAIPQDQMARFLEEKEIEFYKYHLEQILRYREHTLTDKEEKLLAASGEMSRAARDGFDMLDNADLQLGEIEDESGEPLTLTHGNFQSLMQNYDRRMRKDAFHTYYKAYESHRFTYSTLLSSSVKKDLFYSRSRNYSGYRAKALFSENISEEVYDNLIESVHQNLKPLYKYFEIRKKLLGLDELHAYDCSVPLVKNIKWHMPYEEAVEKIKIALQPLGAEYNELVGKGLLQDRWTDRYENKGKRSGAYSSGCYDSNPFILMNYTEDNINSVYTLAHEAGHSMHSLYSRKNQPYLYSDYTIFVAEVASTFNESLLTKYFLSQDIDREMRVYLLCREIDNFRGTLYRQTMFAEFEHKVYEAAENNQPLTIETFQEIYKGLLDLYFGPGLVLDDCLSLECFRIPHFYFSFYVYKYATGISAAYALADRVLSGGDKELDDYLNFLKSGGSKYPIDLLKGAGVDMTSPEPVRTALSKFSSLVDELESLTLEN